MRRVVVALVAVILVNLPWAHDAWVQHRLDTSGVPVTATIVDRSHKRGHNFVSYRFSKSVDPRQQLFDAVVSDPAYREAVATGHLPATVLRGSPASNRLEGEVTGSQVVVIAVVGDVIIALVGGFVLLRRRRWSRLRITGVDGDVLTFTLGDLTLNAELADDPDSRALRPEIGRALRAVVYLVPTEDVEEGPPLGEVRQVGPCDYRVAGRVRSLSVAHTEIVLDNGYPLLVVSDEVGHLAELRGPVQAVGTLRVAAARPM